MKEVLLNSKALVEGYGQVLFYQELENEFIVPEGVYSICGVIVGDATDPQALGGAGLAWRNNIPVTPGEVLTVSLVQGLNKLSSLKRGEEVLLGAYSPNSQYGGLGGKNASSINDGGGNGGTSTYKRAGAGAGGYTGNGGNSNNLNQNGAKGNGGGGGGGASTGTTSSSTIGRGGGVGLNGKGADGIGGIQEWGKLSGGGGSIGDGTSRAGDFGGGNGGRAGCRLIWGANRFFPNTNTGDV